jgi:hypothetical protein
MLEFDIMLMTIIVFLAAKAMQEMYEQQRKE